MTAVRQLVLQVAIEVQGETHFNHIPKQKRAQLMFSVDKFYLMLIKTKCLYDYSGGRSING